MRLRTNISLIVFSVVSILTTETLAQTYLSEITVEVEHQQGELKDLVSELEVNTGFTFAYLDQSLQNKQISLGHPSWQMDELLKQVSVQAGVSVKRVGGSIAVADAEKDKVFPQFVDETENHRSINGSVMEGNGAVLPYANVLLLSSSDSSLVKGAITDTQGRYSFSEVYPGDYLIESRLIGFTPEYSPAFQVQDKHLAIHPIRLKESINELDEVIVEPDKPLLEQRIDRLVVNVGGQPVFAGHSAYEVLKKVPGMSFNPMTNSINFNGKRGVMIIIDGKSRMIRPDELPIFLEGIPASNIEKVELITNPSSNYDAEGVAGVIQILSKRNKDKGLSGSFMISPGYGPRERVQTSGNINYQNRSLSLFSQVTLLRDSYYEMAKRSITIQNPEYVYVANSSSKEAETIQMLSFNISAEYKLSEKTTVGVLSDFYFRHCFSDTDIHSYYSIEPGVDTVASSTRVNVNVRDFFTANLSLEHLFNNSQQLNLNLDYLLFNNDQDQHFIHELIPQNDHAKVGEDILVTKINPTRILVGKADYKFEIAKKTLIETGIKASLNVFDNTIISERLLEEVYAEDPYFSLFSSRIEKILAGYGFVSTSIGEISLKTGLRYEHTSMGISDDILIRSDFNTNGKVFPSLFLERKLGKSMAARISYTSRISRPSFKQLSLSPKFWSPRAFQIGNSMLDPVYTQTINSTWRLQKLTCSFEYNLFKNDIWMQPRKVMNADELFVRPINFDRSKLAGVTFSFPLIVTDWWEINSHLGFFKKKVVSNQFSESVAHSARYLTANSFHQFTLPQEFLLQLHGSYISDNIFGLTRRSPYGTVSLGVSKGFGERGGNLALNVTNILGTLIVNSENLVPEDNLILRNYYRDFRHFRVTYTNTFGNHKIKTRSKRKGGAEEELKRL